MKNKIINLKTLLIFSIFIIMAFFIIKRINDNKPLNYNSAKAKCVKIFNKYKDEFLSTKSNILASKSSEGFSLKNAYSIRYEWSDYKEIIVFDIDAQGFLGGQYWGILYVSNDLPTFTSLLDFSTLTQGPYSGSYFYQESGGNDFYATERIEEGWYFFYMDYDGNRHELDWQSE